MPRITLLNLLNPAPMRIVPYIASVIFAAATCALAQGYPEKPLRLVVPYPPGGNIDITARSISPGLSELLRQSVVIDNRSGAGGTIGADHVAKAPADGYTILVGSSGTLTVAPSLYTKNPYHPVRDFAPVSFVSTVPLVLVVHPTVPAKTVKELIAIAKPKPNRLSMASAGTGTTNHLTGEMFQAMRAVYGEVPARERLYDAMDATEEALR